MSTGRTPARFLCNGASPPVDVEEAGYKLLDYRPLTGSANVRLGLPDFVRSVYHLPDRCLDLLEIAAYVFAGDRLTPRGAKDSVEYHSWTRNLHYVVRVRDYAFWSRPDVQEALRAALCFMTGDQSYEFTFQPGHSTSQADLFDSEAFQSVSTDSLSVMLFSGGLDSLAGAIQHLEETHDHVCLVSHQSSQPSIMRTQKALANALQDAYPNRVNHYQFRTSLQGVRAKEETQRTRSFLYGSIAFAIAKAYGQDRVFVYENGVTSLNFVRRDDLLNARASRTTHPQTLGRLAELFSLIAEQPVSIETPFLWKTKTDVVEGLIARGFARLIPSSVSCSHTFKSGANATHCGECFQCIDRRIGVYGAQAEEHDQSGLYANDIIRKSISNGQSKTTIIDYLRQAANFANWNVDYFYSQTLDDLQHLNGWAPDCDDEMALVDKVWYLCSQHGNQVGKVLRRMQDLHEDVFAALAPDSLLALVSDREFLREPIERLVMALQTRLEAAIPKVFRTEQPKNEADLNDKIEGLLTAWRDDIQREHPAVPFASAGVKPDFSLDRAHLLIEGKYIRGNTSPSRSTEGMAADLTKYPQEAHILFVVHDSERAIADRDKLKRDFEDRGRCNCMHLAVRGSSAGYSPTERSNRVWYWYCLSSTRSTTIEWTQEFLRPGSGWRYKESAGLFFLSAPCSWCLCGEHCSCTAPVAILL